MDNPLFQAASDAGLLQTKLNHNQEVITEASLLKLNTLLLFNVPGELLPKLGLAYKAKMKAAGATLSAVVGLVNDELGYILPKEGFIYPDDPLNPGDHYEESMSLSIEAGPCLTKALQHLLGR